jgi:hypothetical protein
VPPIVTLLTDFGLVDSYVAEVKGVLLSMAPRVELIDISHDIAAGDIRTAAYVLGRAWPAFPEGTVHLAVVDPGVGTGRRALAATSGGHYFVAPDNGILSSLPAGAQFVAFEAPPGVAPTFHGRDVFAPAAAALANGTGLTHLGPIVTDARRLPLARVERRGESWHGEVIHVDRFGTLVSNVLPPPDRAAGASRVRVGDRDIGPVVRTFADVPRGAPVAFVGSGGTIEIAVRDGNATRELGVGVGAPVVVTIPKV